MPLLHPSVFASHEARVPRTFFQVVCAHLLTLRGPSGSGVVAVSVDGQGGGRWVMDLRRAKIESSNAPADLTITLAPGVFEGLLERRVDVASEFARQGIKVQGDVRLLGRLANLFASPIPGGAA